MKSIKQQKPEKLNLQSMSITEEKKKKLRQLFPEVFNEKKIDWEKLKTTLGEELESDRERYNMNWPGKKDCFRIIQEPSLGTLKPCKEESLDWNKTQNLFIEGDNLEVLKLLQRSYYNKVKMIYIDPPYNTGKDFIYPDKYSETLETYLQYTGQKDAEGKRFSTNQESDGRFHSKWINMMYPRLFLARNLLKDDGVIFISIDDNEITNLKKICNEVFGEENFVACITWQNRVSPANDAKWFSGDHEYLVVYCKDKDMWFPKRTKRTKEHNKYYTNPDNDPRGPWNSAAYTCNKNKMERPNLYYPIKNPNTLEEIWPDDNAVWAYSQDQHKKNVEKNLLYWGKNGQARAPRRKQFLSEAKPVVPRSVWSYSEAGSTQKATMEIRELFDGASFFTYPKPVDLLKKIIYHATDNSEENLVLDFFAGSATTAHAVYENNLEDGGNRKYICVQLPEPTQEDTASYKAGYKTISDIGKERICRTVKKIKEKNKQQSLLNQNKSLDLGFKVFKLDKSNFKIWDEKISKDKLTSEQVEMHLENFVNPKSSEEDLLYEILIKNGFKLTTKIKILNLVDKTVYSVENNAFIICLDKTITKDLIIEMAKLKPARVVCLDIGFENKDQLKTNAMETFTSHGVRDFKTI